MDPIPNVIDNSFLKKYARRVLFSGKFKGLSFFTNPLSNKINVLQRNNIGLAEDAGLYELANETVFDNIDMCQMTRGTKGNLQLALITQRNEFKDSSEQKKRGFWDRVVKDKSQEQPPQV